MKQAETVLESAREIPVLHRTDVLVVGGGPAGLAAGTATAIAVAQRSAPRGIDRSALEAARVEQGVRMAQDKL